MHLPPLTGQTPVYFIERVDRYVQAEPALRLRMAIGETLPTHPERLVDIERELNLQTEHTKEQRPGPRPTAWSRGHGRPHAPSRPSWCAGSAARAALDYYTLAMVLRHGGRLTR